MESKIPENATLVGKIPAPYWLLIPDGILLGLALAIMVFWDQGLYGIPGFAMLGGALGATIAGARQAFARPLPKPVGIVSWIALGVMIFFVMATAGFTLLILIPMLVASFVIYFLAFIVTVQLTKTPINWLVFGIILVVAAAISLALVGFVSIYGAGFMAQ